MTTDKGRMRAAWAGTFLLSIGAGVALHLLLSVLAGGSGFVWDHGPLARACYAIARHAAEEGTGWASLLAGETILFLLCAALLSFIVGVAVSSLSRGAADSAVGYGLAIPLLLLPLIGLAIGGDDLAATERLMGESARYYAMFFLVGILTVCYLAAHFGARVPGVGRAKPEE
jgi:hypothetical protein